MAILPCAVHGSIAHGRARDIRGATAPPLILRSVLPGARPSTVRSLECFTVDVVVPSRRVTVPLTLTFTFTRFVVSVSNFACDAPASSLNANDALTVRPWSVLSGQ